MINGNGRKVKDDNNNAYYFLEENSLFWENDIREMLKDFGLSSEVIEKILTSIHLEPLEGENDFVIDYYQLRSLLSNLEYKFPNLISTLTKFKSFLYPKITDDYIESNEIENRLRNFKFKKKEIKKILTSVYRIKNYQTKTVYYSKDSLRRAFINCGYSDLIYENIIYYPKQNYALNEILALIFDNSHKVYLSIDSIFEVSERLFKLAKIGPKNTKFIAEKVKVMADIIEGMKKNTPSAFDYYTKQKILLPDFIESKIFRFDEGFDEDFMQRHTDLVMIYNHIKSLINRKKIVAYAEEQGIKIQKNELKKSKKSKDNCFSRIVSSLKKKVSFIKNFLKNYSKNTIKDYIGEKLNDLYAQRLSCMIYNNSNKYASVDVTKLTNCEINKWIKDNQRLMKRFEKYNKSKYCSVSLPFTADIDIMEYLFNINHSFEQISNISSTFLLEKKELESLDEVDKNYIINYLALAQDKEKFLFESYEYQNEINRHIKKKIRNRFVAVLGGMIAAISVTSYIGVLSFKNFSKEKNNETEITTDLKSDSLKPSVLDGTGFVIDNNIKVNPLLNSGKTIIEDIVNEIKQDNFNNNEKQDSLYPGEIVIEGTINNKEDVSLNQESFISIGDSVDTINNAKVYNNHIDLATNQNSMKSYFGSDNTLNRTVRAIVLEDSDHYVQVVYNNDEIKNYIENDYDVIGYQIDNKYSFDKNDNYLGSEGIYNDEDVMKLTLKK